MSSYCTYLKILMKNKSKQAHICYKLVMSTHKRPRTQLHKKIRRLAKVTGFNAANPFFRNLFKCHKGQCEKV